MAKTIFSELFSECVYLPRAERRGVHEQVKVCPRQKDHLQQATLNVDARMLPSNNPYNLLLRFAA